MEPHSSIQSSQGSEASIDIHYGVVSQESEVSRRQLRGGPQGPASFLSLLRRLEVPVLNGTFNRAGLIDAFLVGAGSSYNVTQSTSTLEHIHGQSPEINIDRELKQKKYVIKRVLPQAGAHISDQVQLAAITNEVRILANETLKKIPFIIKLLCVAWDETPVQGRCWPRLLLECADYGNLAQFMARHESSRRWRVKEKILGDILAGLNMLRCHHVVHGDLKLENVLVFAADTSNPQEYIETHGIKYTAKLCDFGFSVILSDYDDEDSTFTERLGTDPWNAPELAYGTPIKVRDLPKADVYSFALLMCRVLMDGGNPFQGLRVDEIRPLKQNTNSFELYEKVSSSAFDGREYPNLVELLLRRTLLLTLGYEPEQRMDLDLVGKHFMMLLTLSDETLNAKHPEQSSDHPTTGSKRTDTSKWNDEGTQAGQVPTWSVLSILPELLYGLRYIAQKLWWPIFAILKRVRNVFQQRVLTESTWDDLFKSTVVPTEPIAPMNPLHEIFQKLKSSEQHIEDPGQPDFEFFKGPLKPEHLSPGASEELIKEMHELASDLSDENKQRKAGAAFQLSIVHFHGSSNIKKDTNKSLEWLRKAVFWGSPEAVSGCHNVHESCKHHMPPEVEALIVESIPEVAKDALNASLVQTLTSNHEQKDAYTAIRKWSEDDEPAYFRYICSPEHGGFSALCLAVQNHMGFLRTSEEPRVAEDFDFKLLGGYNHHDMKNFGPSDKAAFVESVRQHCCVEATGFGGLTLLQKAAAEGNLTLVDIMINEFGAKVDAVGNTKGLTPLWISCLTGNIHVGRFLAAHGADLRCKDSDKERTILHFANKCRSKEDLTTLLDLASQAGLDLDVMDADGNTPLLSTFIGWDFSKGLASLTFIEKSVNVLVESKKGYTPLGLASGKLDVGLVRRLIRAMDGNQHEIRAAKSPSTHMSSEEAKADGFLTLGNHTEFYNTRLWGQEALPRLEEIVDMLLDEGSISALRTSKYARDTNPLIGACFTGNEDLILAVLKANHCPDVNETDPSLYTALHWTVERKRLKASVKLLRCGADPTRKSNEEFTVLHTAAIHCPELLESLLNAVEESQEAPSQSLDVASLLQETCRQGLSVFDLMVMEGSPDHLEAAESIRVKYALSIDEMRIPEPGHGSAKKTLLATMVQGVNASKILTLSSVEYLLRQKPPPRLVCRTDGATLLHEAVESWHHDDYSSNSSGYAALKLLLDHFPGTEHLATADNSGCIPLHKAASLSHLTAIKIIHDHTKTRNLDMNVNRPDLRGFTPLDYVNRIIETLNLDEETHKVTLQSLRLRTAKTYEYLRQNGACYSHELRPVVINLMGRCQNEVSKTNFLQFIVEMARRMELHWEYIEETIEDSIEGTELASFVLELAWRFDQFILHATQVSTADLAEHIARRVEHRNRVVQQTQNWPWLISDFEETIQGHTVRWTRAGRVWTIRERKRLTEELIAAWEQVFPTGSSKMQFYV